MSRAITSWIGQRYPQSNKTPMVLLPTASSWPPPVSAVRWMVPRLRRIRWYTIQVNHDVEEAVANADSPNISRVVYSVCLIDERVACVCMILMDDGRDNDRDNR
mmetsp:Transcript_5140/g.13835  ORF Transcript_5140/g.13835 Transcript_5140/m.13835 type:complete len:104 (+) Transcript_5140:686-997(+)